jgi:hypothetical protein
MCTLTFRNIELFGDAARNRLLAPAARPDGSSIEAVLGTSA